MANKQKPVQPQTMTSQQESEDLSDEQLEQISGGNGTTEMPVKKPGGMSRMGKFGVVGAGLLGVGALTEGGIALHQNQQNINETKKVDNTMEQL